MTVYSKLGISYTPAEVFGLPQEIGSSAFFNGHDTMLLYNFPEVDVSIYGYTWSDNSTWVMLRDGEEIFTTNLEYKLVPDTIVKAIYGNFDLQSSNDNEIIFIAKSTDAQLSCGFDHMIYVAYWSDGDLEIQGLYDYGLQMNNLVSLGKYVDRPNLIYIFYEGYNIAGNLLYEKDEISVDITEYINSGYEEYKLADFCSSDVYFHLDNGKISCSLGIYLEFKDMADHVQIGIAEATISYSKEAAGLTFEDVTLKNLE